MKENFFNKSVVQFEIMPNFAPHLRKVNAFGALVQLVRIHACHAWGHGSESHTHRQIIVSSEIRKFQGYFILSLH